MMFTFLRYDSIKYLIVNDNESEARFAIRQLYKHANSDEECDMYIDELRKNLGTNTSNLTLSDALFDPLYRKATWVNIG